MRLNFFQLLNSQEQRKLSNFIGNNIKYLFYGYEKKKKRRKKWMSDFDLLKVMIRAERERENDECLQLNNNINKKLA